MFHTRLFRPVLMAEEGLDTAAFFGDQTLVDETKLPDANSPELLNDAPEPGAVDQLPADADEADANAPAAPNAGRKQFVPLGALQEERTKRQAQQEENRVLQERMNQFLQLQLELAEVLANQFHALQAQLRVPGVRALPCALSGRGGSV